MFLPLYWLYLWQTKEYKWYRLVSHLKLLNGRQLLLELLWGRYRRPLFTLKLITISAIAGTFSLLCLLYILFADTFSIYSLVIGIVTVWFASPLNISLAVILVSILESPIKEYKRKEAKNKAERLLNDTLIIGVTGSYAKTTTKEFIAQILSAKFNVARTPHHVNNDIALANFLLNDLNEAPEILIVEYASYGLGNIEADMENIIRPDWAVLTGIAPQHLELFGSLENIIQEKLSLARKIPDDGKVFYNAYDSILKNAVDEKIQKDKIAYSKDGILPLLEVLSWRNSLRGQILEQMMPSNLAAAIVIAGEMGMSEDEIRQVIEDVEWLPRTLQVIENGFTVIDDSYSSNPVGFEKLIKFVDTQKYPFKLLVTNGVIELGKDSFEINNSLCMNAQKVFGRIYVTNQALASAWEKNAEEGMVFSGSLNEIKKKTRT